MKHTFILLYTEEESSDTIELSDSLDCDNFNVMELTCGGFTKKLNRSAFYNYEISKHEEIKYISPAYLTFDEFYLLSKNFHNLETKPKFKYFTSISINTENKTNKNYKCNSIW